ncbi:LCP family protein [Actinomycetospora endophytica]|uniref:LCP family protein n=1 Tax=Actinomycetospora endophytica TaxID=2291215 RepID=A0ABS8P580_9PSEU|nr:LCP family protein [Actinomycetospora endophytica]MCD2193409.1 LCP family protein [Actinomycetospora endophytica]
MAPAPTAAPPRPTAAPPRPTEAPPRPVAAPPEPRSGGPGTRVGPPPGLAEPPPPSSPPQPPQPPQPPRSPKSPKGPKNPKGRARWGRRLAAVVGVLLLLGVGFGIYLDTQMTRTQALSSYGGRPAGGSGTNWLLVGSDSRAGLSSNQEQQLSTGAADGSRTDTMMLVHVAPFGGQTSIISLPRDSLVNVDGNKARLNSAYSAGGPQLLTRTVEQSSGLHIDHYAEIGFEGFASMVDAVGGVNMCLDQPLDDPKAGINLQTGCQDLDGTKALGYVRSRAFPDADLQRVQNQRKFLSALMAKATSPLTLANPFATVPFANASVGTLTVDGSDHVWNLASLGWAMHSVGSGGVTTTVPVSPSSSVSGAVDWDKRDAPRLWNALRSGDDIPPDLVTSGK